MPEAGSPESRALRQTVSLPRSPGREVDRLGENAPLCVADDHENAVQGELLGVVGVQGLPRPLRSRAALIGPVSCGVLHARQQGIPEQEEERHAEDEEYRPDRERDEQRQAPPDGQALMPPFRA